MIRLFAIAAVLATACGSAEPEASPVEKRTRDLAVRMIDMALKVKGAVEASLGDCDKAAMKLDALATDAKLIRDQLTKLGADGKVDAALRAAWEKEGPLVQAGVKAALESIKPALDRCKGNAAFQRAEQHAGFLFKKSI